MAITYTWAITELALTTVGQFQDYVVQSRWTCTGTDESGNTGMFSGATPFAPDPSQPDYTPYDQLTEAQVLGWIQAVVVGTYWEHVEGVIAEQIALKKDPVTPTSQFPWSPPAPPGPTPAPTPAP
jgi:hypothetical protein